MHRCEGQVLCGRMSRFVHLLRIGRAGAEAAERQLVQGYGPRATHDARRCRLGSGRLRHGSLRACARLRQTVAAVRTSDRPIPTGPGSAGPDARQYHRFTVPGLAPLADAGRRHDAGGARVSGEGLLRSPTRTTRRRRISCSWSPKPWTRRGTMACPCTPARSATGASWLTRSSGHQGHRQAPRMRPSIDGD